MPHKFEFIASLTEEGRDRVRINAVGDGSADARRVEAGLIAPSNGKKAQAGKWSPTRLRDARPGSGAAKIWRP